MGRWVQISQVQSILGINPNHGDEPEWNQWIDQAQFHDVKTLLGDDLYHDLDADPTATGNGDYPALINGGFIFL